MERFSPRHEDLPETPPPSALTGEGICGQVKKFHAVLVEDDADDRFLCCKVLKSCPDIGDVVSYKDGQEAVSGMRGISQGESCAAGGCDTLFVIDLNMPLMDGFKLLGRIKAHPALRQERFLTGEPAEDGSTEIAWYRADGAPMDDAAWQDENLRTLCLFLARPANGEGADQLLIVCNAGEDCAVTLPEVNGIAGWKRVLDTGAEEGAFTAHDAGSPATVYAASLAVFEPA